MKSTQIRVSIPTTHHDAIVLSGEKVSEVVRSALREYFENHPKRYAIPSPPPPMPKFLPCPYLGDKDFRSKPHLYAAVVGAEKRKFLDWCEQYKLATGRYPPQWRTGPEWDKSEYYVPFAYLQKDSMWEPL